LNVFYIIVLNRVGVDHERDGRTDGQNALSSRAVERPALKPDIWHSVALTAIACKYIGNKLSLKLLYRRLSDSK